MYFDTVSSVEIKNTGRIFFRTPVMFKIRETAEIPAKILVSFVSFSIHLLIIQALMTHGVSNHIIQSLSNIKRR